MKPFRATSELDTAPTTLVGARHGTGGLDGLADEPLARPPTAEEQHAADLRAVGEIARAHDEIVAQIEKRIVGQRKVVEHLLTALFARGHCLFVGVPGLAKTLLIST